MSPVGTSWALVCGACRIWEGVRELWLIHCAQVGGCVCVGMTEEQDARLRVDRPVSVSLLRISNSNARQDLQVELQ